MSELLAVPELLLVVAMPEQMSPFLLAMPELLLVVEASQHPPPGWWRGAQAGTAVGPTSACCPPSSIREWSKLPFLAQGGNDRCND